MPERMRDPRETRDIGIKRLKDEYEKNNRTTCPPEQIKKFIKMYEKDILPRVYDKDKK